MHTLSAPKKRLSQLVRQPRKCPFHRTWHHGIVHLQLHYAVLHVGEISYTCRLSDYINLNITLDLGQIGPFNPDTSHKILIEDIQVTSEIQYAGTDIEVQWL